jgi:hypothetical protein
MHQGAVSAWQKAVIDKKVLFHRELGIAAFKIARAITVDAVAQRQILRAGGSSNRICLDESQFLDRARKRGRLEQRACNGIAAQEA